MIAEFSGLLIIVAQEVQASKSEVVLKCAASHLDKKDFFGKSDPFIEVSVMLNDGSWVRTSQSNYCLLYISLLMPLLTMSDSIVTDPSYCVHTQDAQPLVATLHSAERQAHWQQSRPAHPFPGLSFVSLMTIREYLSVGRVGSLDFRLEQKRQHGLDWRVCGHQCAPLLLSSFLFCSPSLCCSTVDEMQQKKNFDIIHPKMRAKSKCASNSLDQPSIVSSPQNSRLGNTPTRACSTLRA